MLQTCKMHPKIKMEQKNNVRFHTLVHCGRTCEDLRPEPFLTDGASDQAQIPANDSTNRREYQQTTRIRWHPQNLKVTEGRKKQTNKKPTTIQRTECYFFLKTAFVQRSRKMASITSTLNRAPSSLVPTDQQC